MVSSTEGADMRIMQCAFVFRLLISLVDKLVIIQGSRWGCRWIVRRNGEIDFDVSEADIVCVSS